MKFAHLLSVTALILSGWLYGQLDGAEISSLRGALELKNEKMRIVFADAKQGFSCIGIENLLENSTRFVLNNDELHSLWQLQFAEPTKSGKEALTGVLDTSRSIFIEPQGKPCKYEKIPNGLRFIWNNVDLPGETGVVDVICEVDLPPGRDFAQWNIKVNNRSKKYGLWEYSYPRLRQVFVPGTGDAMLPGGNWGGRFYRNNINTCGSVIYPSGSAVVQFMAFNLRNSGFYYAAHDGNARAKIIQCFPDQSVSILTMAEDMGEVGSGCQNEFPVATGVYLGNWVQAAKIYRHWAQTQKWTAAGLIAERTDYPSKWRDFGFFLLVDGEPERVAKIMNTAQKKVAGRVPVGVHWYSWFKAPINTCVGTAPVYTPKPGMPELSARLSALGQLVMPYIDAYLWSMEDSNFASAIPATARKDNGDMYIEAYEPKCAVMCSATKFWQDILLKLAIAQVKENNANAVYFDELALQPPTICYDRTHGHKLGGGSYWVDGYRDLLTQIREITAPLGIPITVEAAAEPYMDLVDGFLIWGTRESEDVPVLTAVYSGYTTYFSSRIQPEDTVKSFFISMGRDIIWGCQPGWIYEFILDDEHREHWELLVKLTELRLAAKSFLLEGELVDVITPHVPVEDVTVDFFYRTKHSVTVPKVQGVLWKNSSNELLVAMMNASDTDEVFAFDVPASSLLGTQKGWMISELSTTGRVPLRYDSGDVLQFSETLPGTTIRFLVISPQ